MNKKKGLATVWLLIMITLMKVGTIVALCAMHADLSKLFYHTNIEARIKR